MSDVIPPCVQLLENYLKSKGDSLRNPGPGQPAQRTRIVWLFESRVLQAKPVNDPQARYRIVCGTNQVGRPYNNPDTNALFVNNPYHGSDRTQELSFPPRHEAPSY